MVGSAIFHAGKHRTGLDPTSTMRAATLKAPFQAGNDGHSASDTARAAEEPTAATGPQRSLEASSFINIGATETPMDDAFDALPMAAIVSYRDGADLRLNPPARTLLSLGDEDRLRSIEDLHAHARLVPAKGEPDTSPLRRALEGERVTATMRARVQDGDERCWAIDAAPIRREGAITGAICTIRDITERVLDEEMGDDLLGRASHDLRTPLTALKASAQLIGRGFERLDANARKRTLGLLLAQIDKLSARIDEVMDASRIRRGRIDVQAEEIDVTAILRDVASELALMPGMPQCELAVPDALTARGDRARLRQIVKRFATDAASRGTQRILIEASRADDTVTIAIEIVGERLEEARSRTARRLAKRILERLGGSARDERAERLVLTLPASA